MNETAAAPGKYRGFGLVRDKDGNPMVDDPETLPEEIKAMLTKDDIQYLKDNDKWL